MNLLIDIPLLVRASVKNLIHPKLDSPHPLSPNLVMMVCKLSGNPYLSTEFLQKLPISSCSLGESTKKQYNVYINQWRYNVYLKVLKTNTMFAPISERVCDPIHPTIKDVLYYLYSLYDKGLSYSA